MAVKKGERLAEKHGGSAAIARIHDGAPFTGMAAAAQGEVEARLETEGTNAVIRLNAIRNQTVVDLYWAAIVKAAEAGDIDLLDRYVARYGWLSGVAGRGWDQVIKAERAGANGPHLDVLIDSLGAHDANDQ